MIKFEEKIIQCLNSELVLLDTCFIMDRNFEFFTKYFEKTLQDNPAIILDSVARELHKNGLSPDVQVSEQAHRGGEIVQSCLDRGLIIGKKDKLEEPGHADPVFLRIAQQYRHEKPVTILTNDRDLIMDLQKINSFQSSNHVFPITVLGTIGNRLGIWASVDHKTVKSTDRFSCYVLINDNSSHNTRDYRQSNNSYSGNNGYTQHSKQTVFKTNCSLDVQKDFLLKISPSNTISEGSSVYTYQNGKSCTVRLGDKINSGGEGTVYQTDRADIVCKIYHDNKTTNRAKRKIELMTSYKISEPGICWPSEAVYDLQGVFRGFLMPKARGTKLATSLFKPSIWLKKNPRWTRIESVKLALTILKKINYLHGLGVLIGDINDNNILIENEYSVFWVDCDSFQVEGFPCPVGMPTFVAPEIQEVTFSESLRTKEHELFAVATLLFMIMLPGKTPYSHQGGEDATTNIKTGHFPYALGEQGSDRVPEGPWRYCWSHLSKPLKNRFFQVFHSSMRNQSRPDVGEWIFNFEKYLEDLQNPREVFVGPKQNYGIDLQILPQNRQRSKHSFTYDSNTNYDPQQPLRSDGKTDQQARAELLAQQILEANVPPKSAQDSFYETSRQSNNSSAKKGAPPYSTSTTVYNSSRTSNTKSSGRWSANSHTTSRSSSSGGTTANKQNNTSLPAEMQWGTIVFLITLKTLFLLLGLPFFARNILDPSWTIPAFILGLVWFIKSSEKLLRIYVFWGMIVIPLLLAVIISSDAQCDIVDVWIYSSPFTLLVSMCLYYCAAGRAAAIQSLKKWF